LVCFVQFNQVHRRDKKLSVSLCVFRAPLQLRQHCVKPGALPNRHNTKRMRSCTGSSSWDGWTARGTCAAIMTLTTWWACFLQRALVNEVLQLQTRTIWQNLQILPAVDHRAGRGSKDARRQGNSALGQTDPGAGAYPWPGSPGIWSCRGCAGTKRSLDQWFVDALSFEGSDWQHVCMIIWVGESHRLLWRTSQCRRAHSPKDHAVHCCSPTAACCTACNWEPGAMLGRGRGTRCWADKLAER
jgi:hypothetical protein